MNAFANKIIFSKINLKHFVGVISEKQNNGATVYYVCTALTYSSETAN